MGFLIHALPIEPFSEFLALSNEALQARGARRVVADANPGFPCRVSLQDAEPGERVVLLPYAHHAVDSPYRASGPIYVRERAVQAQPQANEVPALLRTRLLSLRGYDAKGMMRTADAVPGADLEAGIASVFAHPKVAYVHLHYAKPGCYACRVERA